MNAPMPFDQIELHRMHVERRVLLDRIDQLEHSLEREPEELAAAKENAAENAAILRPVRAALDDVSWFGLPGAPTMESAIRSAGGRLEILAADVAELREARDAWKERVLRLHNEQQELLAVPRVPPELDHAIRDLLARLDARGDVGADTRLAMNAVRQELQAATTTKKETT